MFSKKLLAFLGLLFTVQPAHAQSWEAEWAATVKKAQSQKLSAMVAGEEAYNDIFKAFTKKFGIETEATVARPSQALARMRTEQKNGQFLFDLWMGGTSNMSNVASPAGLLEPMEKYFILPEVKDPKAWRHPNFLFGDSQRAVFTNANRVEFYILRNTKVVPEVKIKTWDDFLNPKFKGKIVIREATVPNSATFALATMYGVKGEAFLRKLLKDQEPKIYENPQQLDAMINRGGAAISIGLEAFVWDKCRADGGCQDVESMRNFGAATSAGFSVPKNPPNLEAIKVFINWFLSKEGQEVWVKSWAIKNTSGGVSMRVDVPPAPGHEAYLPDFHHPDDYVFVSSEKGREEVNATIKIFKEVTGH
jgi:iron(III) transport system substrate-binding protein